MSGLNDYYAKHSRKVSSSQTSLPDQLRNSSETPASKSTTFLPSTTYLKPRSASIDPDDSASYPDSFYRQYNSQNAQLKGASLRQGAIKTSDLDAVHPVEKGRKHSFASASSLDGRRAAYENGQLHNVQDSSKVQTISPGLRGRKSSVKNMIAQFNATTTEPVPPVPTNSTSRIGSRNVSPIMLSNARFQPSNPSRGTASVFNSETSSKYDTNGVEDHSASGDNFDMALSGSSLDNLGMSPQNRRPLFGELVPGLSNLSNVGYGIQALRGRSGSEGSPLLNSNSPIVQHTDFMNGNGSNTAQESETSFTLSPAVYTLPTNSHRRVNSESPLTPTKSLAELTPQQTPYALQNVSTQTRERIGPSGTPTTPRGHRDGSEQNEQSSYVVSNSRSTSKGQKQPGPRSRRQSPPQIQSPGQRGKRAIAAQGSKSPLLRANIIVPPPKISPPLRSSRPRMPVSSASTAASRAKMAEKFSNMHKIHDEKRQAIKNKGRPPELTDIDLKARRLRITQALSRSLEGQDLRGNAPPRKQRNLSGSRTASPALSDRSQRSNFSENWNDIPAVVVDAAAVADDRQEALRALEEKAPRESKVFVQNALDAAQGATLIVDEDEDADSPTLGGPDTNFTGRPSPLQTNFLNTRSNYEPWSAVTDNTENTNIDPEPQDTSEHDARGPSILSSVRGLRNSDRLHQASHETFSDRGDQESVQLILRDTLYLDDDEAVQKGYRPAQPSNSTFLESPEVSHTQRSSWISSMDESDGQQDETEHLHMSNHMVTDSANHRDRFAASVIRGLGSHNDAEDSVRSTLASDAYTIVNIVLQRHSTSGIVDQQFVDDVYQRILEDSPVEGALNAEQIEQMCLREIQDREETWYRSASDDALSEQLTRPEEDKQIPEAREKSGTSQQTRGDWARSNGASLSLAPPPAFRGHKYKSSLDSAEDWADTSPSVSDWIRFAANDTARHSVDQKTDTLVTHAESTTKDTPAQLNTSDRHDNATQNQEEDPDLYAAPQPRAPSHSPPPLPGDRIPSIEEKSFGTAIIERPSVPRRITSLSQMSRVSGREKASPSASAPLLNKVSTEEPASPEQRRLKKRRNVIKELVDTEFTYEKDLKVLCDIYKQTASAALNDDDIKVLFGNVEQVQEFSKDFLMLLKSLAKPTYVMERPDRKKDRNVSRASSSSTLASAKNAEPDILTAEKDRETQIGQAFEASVLDMEKVYSDYIKNRQAANLRLEVIQKSHSAREWLKECKDNSSDITNAWNLDALLVKPVQRITKYPLLLKELVDSTPEDHPDYPFLRHAMQEVTEINIRINDVKKHAELVDQVLNRKRKDSDVRAGLSKAFGRRAEKLRQQVGMTEMYEDLEYNDIKIHYDNNIVQLMVVGNDCSSYGRAVTKWVNKMVEIAAAAEAWVDVGHSNHQEAESRLRQFAMVVRGISTIALPDHLEQLNNKVLAPMQQSVDAMTRFKTDPKGLLQKREKRMLDYAQIKSKKERGEKVDKKMVERMEQSEALNVEAKERMRKLIRSTAHLVQACQANLIQMQVTWQGMVRQKLAAAMGISLEHLDVDDIEKEWQLDFDFQEASALSLGVCNGSLLAEAVNMVTFPGSGTTLNGEDSPRQASFTSASKRSISLASTNDGSSYPPIPEYDPRTSGTFGHHHREQHFPYGNNRGRAQSATSHQFKRTPDLANPFPHSSADGGYVTSYFGRSDEGLVAPRLSVDTPSPLIGFLHSENSTHRPGTASTCFSAATTPPLQQPPSQQQPQQPKTQSQTQTQTQTQAQAQQKNLSRHYYQQSTGSSIFSSAMPMSDSPVAERHPDSFESKDPDVLFTAASVYEFNIDRSRREAGFPYLTYVTGEIFDVIGERGELWLAKNQDDPHKQIGWIWNKHFAKLAE